MPYLLETLKNRACTTPDRNYEKQEKKNNRIRLKLQANFTQTVCLWHPEQGVPYDPQCTEKLAKRKSDVISASPLIFHGVILTSINHYLYLKNGILFPHYLLRAFHSYLSNNAIHSYYHVQEPMLMMIKQYFL